jgi:hypothetical protein
MTYEWSDNGVKRVTVWSKAVRDAMLKGVAEFQRQKVLNRAACNWSKEFPRTTDIRSARITHTDTWAAEFLLREGESREFLGLWITSGAIHEAKRRRATQIITRSLPCGKWLHMTGARASPRLRALQRERQQRKEASDNIPAETVPHIHSAGCKTQKKSVIGAHKRCWRYLLGAISKLGEAKRAIT